MTEKKFELGRITMTAGVAELVEKSAEFMDFVIRSMARYTKCDWGEMDPDDKELDDEAVKTGDDRIFAAYENKGHPEWKIWIITEWDRSYTTVLFPSEY